MLLLRRPMLTRIQLALFVNMGLDQMSIDLMDNKSYLNPFSSFHRNTQRDEISFCYLQMFSTLLSVNVTVE